MLCTRQWRIAVVTGLVLLAGAAAGQAAGERPPTYVWLFSATGAEAESLTDTVTEEFEEALVKAGCLPIVERRKLPDLQSHQKQEQRIAGANSLSLSDRSVLSTARADAVVFGKITDDIQGGQVKIAVTLETLAGVTLANTSVRISRGKRLDAEEREGRMAELASEVCGALGFKKKEPGANGGDPGGHVPENATLSARFGNVSYRVVNALHTGRELQVWLVATNAGANLETAISFDSSLTDTSGNEHQESARMAGGKRGGLDWFWVTLPYNVPTRFGLAFETVVPNITLIPYMRIKMRDQGWLEFRNIPVPFEATE